MQSLTLLPALPPDADPEARIADLEVRFAFLTRLVYKLSGCVTIPYWQQEEFQELLNSVVLGGDRRKPANGGRDRG